MKKWIPSVMPSESSRARAALGAALACFLVAYAVAALCGLKAHTDPSEMDTVSYLDSALELRRLGGPAAFVANCLSGAYLEATRHPYYLLALSVFARQDVSFFVDAKLMTAWTGAALLLAMVWAVDRLYGRASAVIAAGLLLTNATFIHQSTMVACETPLCLFMFLWWVFAARGFERPRRWLWAGLFSGAAYMTKSLGLFTVAGFVLAVAVLSILRRRAYWRTPYFAAYFAVFLIVASPLLARNLKVHGAFFYNESNSVMWIDRWHDYYKVEDAQNRPTAASYLRTHTGAEIARTLLQGLFFRDVKMTVDGLKPLPFWMRLEDRMLRGYHEPTVPWQGLWAGVLVLLAALGAAVTRRSEATVLALAVSAFLIPFVAWFSKIFPGNPPTRLLHPAHLLWLSLAAVPVGRLLGRRVSEKKLLWGAASAALLYAVSLGLQQDWKGFELKRSYEFSKPFLIQLRWLERNVRPGQIVLAGSTMTANLFYFEPRIGVRAKLWPKVESDDQMRQTVRTSQADFGILDLPTILYNRAYYSRYFDAGPVIGIRQRSPLPEYFKRLAEFPEIPIYEFYRFEGA